MKINTIKEIYVAKIRYPHTAPFKFVCFNNEQAAKDFKDWWAWFANKKCVGAIKKYRAKDIIPDEVEIYSSKDEAANSMCNRAMQRYIEGD